MVERGLAARRDLQPGDLREGDPRLARTTTSSSRQLAARGQAHAREIYRRDGRPRRPGGLRRPAPGLGRDRTAPTATSRSRSTPTSPTTPRARSSRRASTGSRVDRPNLMIKIPGTDEGSRRSSRRSTRASTSTSRCCSASRPTSAVAEALHPRPGAPPGRGQAARPPLRRVASSSRAWTPRSTSASRRSATRSCRAAPAWPTRAPPTSASSEIFDGERFAALREAGAPVQRPLWASTGVKNPHYPDTMYVDGLVAPRHRQHDADGDARWPPPSTARSPARPPTQDPTRGPEALRRGRASTSTTSPTSCCATASTRSSTPMEKLLAGDRGQARGDRHRPPADHRRRRSPTSSSRRRRPHQAGRRGRRRAADLAQGRRRSGAPPGSRRSANRLGWLDDRRRRCSRTLDDLEAFAEEVAPRATPTPCCSAWAARRLAPEVFRQSLRRSSDGGLRLHVLDSTDPERGARRRATRSTSHKTLFLVSSKSGGTIETLSQFKLLLGAPAATARSSWPSPTRARALESWRSEHGFRRVFRNDPDIGGRYSALSYFGLVPAALMGADVAALLEGAQVGRAGLRAYDDPEANSGPVARRSRSASWPLHGRDKLTFVVDEPTRRRSASGPSSSSPSRPASRARASCPSPTSRSGDPDAYGDDRVFLHLRDDGRARRGARRERSTRSRRPATRSLTLTAQGPSDLGRIFFFAEFATAVAGWVLGHQPVRPAQRAGGQGQHGARARPVEAAASCRTSPTPATTSCASCSAGWRRRATSRSSATCRLARASTRAVTRAAGRDPRRARRRRPLRLRPALPALHGPVPQGRPAERALPPARARRRRGRRRSRGGRTRFGHAEAAPRRSATCRRCAATACRPSGCRSTAMTRPALRELTERDQGDALMQLGFVGLGKMGGNMVHRIQRDSDHEVVAFDLNAEAVDARPRSTARRRASLEDLVVQARRAAHGLDHGAGRRPHGADRRRRWPSCSTRATRSSTAATRSGPTTSAAPRQLREHGHRTTSTSARQRRRLGPRGRLLHDGRRRRRGRRAARADPRRARPAADEEHGPGWRHFGPPAPGHYVKMVHNGVEYGIMQAYAEGFYALAHVRVRPRQREDRAPLDAGLGGALLAVRAGRAGVRAGGQRPRRHRGLRRRLRRGPLDDQGRHRPSTSRRR